MATEADAATVTEIFTLAFYEDPTWGWAFPDPERRLEQHRAMWGLFVHSALPYGWVWLADKDAASALWIPPGRPDLSEEDEAAHEPLIRELAGSRADELLELADRFQANHPAEPCYYLSLLGTHPDHRGRGQGIGLLEGNLARIDEQGMPAYLESTNPVNDHRYEALGFAQIGEFSVPGGGPTVATMWRQAR